MMWLRQKFALLMRRPLALLVALAVAGSAVAAGAAPVPSVSWTSQDDFEGRNSIPLKLTSRENLDTSGSPGDVRIGIPNDFVTTATITCITPNRIYSTGVDRASIVVTDSTTKARVKSIDLPAGPAAGVVYNSAKNRLYVGQFNSNQVLVIDVADNDASHTLTIGTSEHTPSTYAAAYNPATNKVYLANTGDRTVTVLDGETDTALATVAVTAGATTAAFDAANTLYLTGKSNNYLTVINGATNQVEYAEVAPLFGVLGGQAPGKVGLRVDGPARGLTGADKLQLTWNADHLLPKQNIQFQIRTAPDVASLDGAIYQGPDGPDSWYDLAWTGATTVTETDGTETTAGLLAVPYAPAAELQLKLSYDGVTSPVLHQVGLSYDWTITASAQGGGSISPSGAVLVPFGASQAFSFQADLGHHLKDLTVDGTTVDAQPGYTFSNVTANHSIVANFAINTYTLNYLAGPHGSISGPTPQTVEWDKDGAAVTALPDPCYHFVSWSDGVLTATRTDTQVHGDITVTANFAINSYTLTYLAGPNGSISGTTPQTVTCGSDGTPVTAVPSPGYDFASWSDGVPSATRVDRDVRADRTVTASFVGYPDLVSSVSGPADATIGGTITVTTRVTNIGPSTAPSSTVGFSLGSTPLAETMPVPSLAPGASFTADTTLTIPATARSGIYQLQATADSGNLIAEKDETNNTSSYAVQMYTAGPDLAVTAVQGTIVDGAGTIDMKVTIKNFGRVNAYLNHTGMYLSTDGVIGNGDDYRLADLVTGISWLGSNQSTVVSFVPVLPKDYIGDYYVGGWADWLNQTVEVDDENNKLTGNKVTINNDLVIVPGSITGSVSAGKLTYSVRVRNMGNGRASTNKTGIYLSTDNVIDPLVDKRVEGVSSGTSVLWGTNEAAISRSNVALTGVAPGTYYLGACADYEGLTPETNESNNCDVSTTQVTVP